jgi:hypothetical protein
MADATTKVVHGGSIAVVASSAAVSLAAAAISSAQSSAIAAVVGTGNASSYPRCDVVLRTANTNTTSSTAMNIPLYRRDINIGGDTSADVGLPGALHSNKYVGSFNMPIASVTGTYYMLAEDIPLPGGNTDCEFYIQNNLTNTMPANSWSLTVYPKADVGATA